jgi:hypothetical protein
MTQTCNDRLVMQAVCFSGDENVNILDNGVVLSVQIRRVLIGQLVQVSSSFGELTFSEVIAVPHYQDNQQRAEFLKISIEGGGSITLTPEHILLVGCHGSTEMLKASSIRTGIDCLVSTTGPKIVEHVSRRLGYGIHTLVRVFCKYDNCISWKCLMFTLTIIRSQNMASL